MIVRSTLLRLLTKSSVHFKNSSFGSPTPLVLPARSLSGYTRHDLKRVFKQYGSIAVGFHIALSLSWLGCTYLVVASGVDLNAFLEKFTTTSGSMESKVAAGAGTFAIAYGVHKMFAPIRIAITVVSTPVIVRYLQRIGIYSVKK